MGKLKVRLGITELVQKKAENGNGNHKVSLGVTELVWKKAENGSGEP